MIKASILVISGEIYCKKVLKLKKCVHNQESSAFEENHCLQKENRKKQQQQIKEPTPEGTGLTK